MDMTPQDGLLGYLKAQADQRKDWFGFTQQKMLSIKLAHEIAIQHANTKTPEEIVDFAVELNNIIYHKIIKPT